MLCINYSFSLLNSLTKKKLGWNKSLYLGGKKTLNIKGINWIWVKNDFTFLKSRYKICKLWLSNSRKKSFALAFACNANYVFWWEGIQLQLWLYCFLTQWQSSENLDGLQLRFSQAPDSSIPYTLVWVSFLVDIISTINSQQTPHTLD